MTRKEEKRKIAIKTLFIIVQEADTYQNDRIDSIYLLHIHIVKNDVILMSFRRQFLLLTLHFTNDVTVKNDHDDS